MLCSLSILDHPVFPPTCTPHPYPSSPKMAQPPDPVSQWPEQREMPPLGLAVLPLAAVPLAPCGPTLHAPAWPTHLTYLAPEFASSLRSLAGQLPLCPWASPQGAQLRVQPRKAGAIAAPVNLPEAYLSQHGCLGKRKRRALMTEKWGGGAGPRNYRGRGSDRMIMDARFDPG